MKLAEYGKWTRIKINTTHGFKIVICKGRMQAIDIRTHYPNASMYSYIYHGKATTFTLSIIKQ